MKLIMSIIHGKDEAELLTALYKKGFSATKLASTGGLLNRSSVTLMTVTESDKLDAAIEIIREKCGTRKTVTIQPAEAFGVVGGFAPFPVEVDVGGATIFVLNVEQLLKV